MSFILNRAIPIVMVEPPSGSYGEQVSSVVFPTGSQAASGSVSVTLAADHPPVVVTGSLSMTMQAGLATETTLATLLKEGTFTTRVPTLGQKAKTGSVPVVLASDQGNLPVAIQGTPSVAVSSLPAVTGSIFVANTSLNVVPQGTTQVGGSVSITNLPTTQPVSLVALPLPTGASTEATLATVLKENTFTARIPTLGQKTMALSLPVVFASDQVLSVTTAVDNRATFTALASNITTGNNKSMMSVLNSAVSGVTIRIEAIFIVNVQNAAVTGVPCTFEMRRMTGHSTFTGTSITAGTLDPDDTLSSGVTFRTGATVTGEVATGIWRNEWSTDEWQPGQLTMEIFDHAFQAKMPMWETRPGCKPLTMKPGQGLTIKCLTNTTTGLFDIRMLVTQE